MSYVDLTTFETKTEHNNNKHVAKVLITIIYSIPKLSVTDKALQVVLYVAG